MNYSVMSRSCETSNGQVKKQNPSLSTVNAALVWSQCPIYHFQTFTTKYYDQ